jgi:hypothetical protein
MNRVGNYVGYRAVAATIALIMFLITICGLALGQQTERSRIDIQTLFTASGWMGDGEYGRQYIDFSGANKINPHSPPTSIKVTYTFGPTRWGGIYWQNEPDNWGDKPGSNYSKKRLSKVTFWARGETGNEVVEFKAGGIDNPKKKYRDSFGVTIGRLTLSKEWKQYHINLANSDLSSVIGGFCWVASVDYNPTKKVTFFLDDIFFE